MCGVRIFNSGIYSSIVLQVVMISTKKSSQFANKHDVNRCVNHISYIYFFSKRNRKGYTIEKVIKWSFSSH